jgi:hypothetical protein
MILTDTEIKRILPIQRLVMGDQLDRVFQIEESQLHLFPRVTLVPYKDKFLLVDGHHRTLRYMFAGRLFVPSEIFESDKEMFLYPRGALLSYYTRETLYGMYHEHWKVLCEEAKIFSL